MADKLLARLHTSCLCIKLLYTYTNARCVFSFFIFSSNSYICKQVDNTNTTSSVKFQPLGAKWLQICFLFWQVILDVAVMFGFKHAALLNIFSICLIQYPLLNNRKGIMAFTGIKNLTKRLLLSILYMILFQACKAALFTSFSRIHEIDKMPYQFGVRY